MYDVGCRMTTNKHLCRPIPDGLKQMRLDCVGTLFNTYVVVHSTPIKTGTVKVPMCARTYRVQTHSGMVVFPQVPLVPSRFQKSWK